MQHRDISAPVCKASTNVISHRSPRDEGRWKMGADRKKLILLSPNKHNVYGDHQVNKYKLPMQREHGAAMVMHQLLTGRARVNKDFVYMPYNVNS